MTIINHTKKNIQQGRRNEERGKSVANTYSITILLETYLSRLSDRTNSPIVKMPHRQYLNQAFSPVLKDTQSKYSTMLTVAFSVVMIITIFIIHVINISYLFQFNPDRPMRSV